MIPVHPQPEPTGFDSAVRQKGLAYLAKKQIALDKPLAKGVELTPYWRSCLDDLHQAYQGVCAYLSVYIERAAGAGSVDHFIAKSNDAGLAYEWGNYRLACSIMNSRKRDYADVLDPFILEDGCFRLELVSGRIYPAPNLSTELAEQVEQTIVRLSLDDSMCRALRARWFQEYIEFQLPAEYLRQKSPFVWYEANRQGLL